MNSEELLEAARNRLVEWGYGVQSQKLMTTAYFEDDVVVGMVAVYETPVELLEHWQRRQESFFRQFAPRLRAAGSKSMNVVLVFVSRSEGSERELIAIEEDFSSARKIARSGVNTEALLTRALLPLGPIASVPSFDSVDPIEELRSRLELPPNAFDALIAGDTNRLIKLIEATL